MYAHINTADDPSTSAKKFGELRSGNPWVLQRRAGYTLGFATRF